MCRVLLALAVILLSGCGTFSDMICGPGGGGPYYRGVRMDAMAIREGHPLAPALAADLPLSAVADTALMPYIAYREAKEKQATLRELLAGSNDDVLARLQKEIPIGTAATVARGRLEQLGFSVSTLADSQSLFADLHEPVEFLVTRRWMVTVHVTERVVSDIEVKNGLVGP